MGGAKPLHTFNAVGQGDYGGQSPLWGCAPHKIEVKKAR